MPSLGLAYVSRCPLTAVARSCESVQQTGCVYGIDLWMELDICGGVWGFRPLCNCYAMNQPASQPRAHSSWDRVLG
eukprot:7262659-Prymnesium_polylepis.1